MKDELMALVQRTPAERAANVAREWLQAAALESLQRAGAMAALVFHGGTALRFLYATRRFSEDVDFSRHGRAAVDLPAWLERLKNDLWREGIPVRAGLARRRRTEDARLEFRTLADELRLGAGLSIRLQVNMDPPAGAGVATSVCRLHRLIQVRHHDPPTLLAGKLHAVLQRHYTKGRDYFDLLWYLSDPAWPEPNLAFLNNALTRSGWKRGAVTAANWREVVLERLARVDWRAARADVRPFLEEPRDANLISYESLGQLLRRRPSPRARPEIEP